MISQLELANVAGEKNVWGPLLQLLPTGWTLDKWMKMDG